MSDVNFVPKLAGTTISDDIDVFFIFFVWFYMSSFWELNCYSVYSVDKLQQQFGMHPQ
jgi:hypothetical protein